MRRWHKALKPVHPAVIALQASGVMAALFFLLMFIQYGQEAPPARVTSVQRTGYNGSLSDGLARMINQLDPAISHDNTKNALEQSILKVHLRQQKRPMPRPEEIYLLRKLDVPRILTVEELHPVPDLSVGSSSVNQLPSSGDFAVMYGEDGKEITRWKSKFYADEKSALTIVRITGKGIMKRTSIIQSCGDNAVDLLAAEQALKINGAPGIYSIFYPAKTRGK